MRAKEIFPDPDELAEVKQVLDMFDGKITHITDGDEVIFTHPKKYVKRPLTLFKY